MTPFFVYRTFVQFSVRRLQNFGTYLKVILGRPGSYFWFNFFSDLLHKKNVLWWDLSHIQKKTENLFLAKIGWAFTLKKSRPTTP